ncbi:hypothetical protein [Kineosporia babensis]|uniref:Uncharacterized protein n=1 Tax=Kineosporia babensis TaxID=499548 RepID=A0A9X1SUZ9_9ACTN|nr:hypothetical protein [Kineosporia babensis]MCD5313329.1 hypothetical protein [Kineosporia babensis]
MVRIPRPRQVRIQEILTAKNAPAKGTGGWWIGLWITSITLLVLAGLVFGGLRLTGVVGGPSAAERQAAALADLQAELRPGLGVLMEVRADFFAAERRYLPAMRVVREAIEKYNTRLSAVESEIDQINAANAYRLRDCGWSCPELDYPSYPKLPKLDPQLKALKSVVRRTGQLHVQLSSLRDTGVLAMSYSELLSAVDLLGQDAKGNLGTLQGMLDRPKNDRYADSRTQLRARTLNGNSSLPVIRRMNGNLVRLLDRARLSVSAYDLPGGRDVSRRDHSRSL